MSNAGPIWTRGRGVIVCFLLVLSLVAGSGAYAGGGASKPDASRHASDRHAKLVKHEVWHQRKPVDHGIRPCPRTTPPAKAASRRTAARPRHANAKITVKRSKRAKVRAHGVARKAPCRSAPAATASPPPTDGGSPPPTDGGSPPPTDGGSLPPPPSANDPGPIAGLGYHEVFRDDFTTFDRTVWDDHIWYDEVPHADWDNFQTVDADGILHLRTSKSYMYTHTVCDETTSPPTCVDAAGNYPANTITTQTSRRTFKYGYFEARMKWTGGEGGWPGFWLYSYRHATNPLYPELNPLCAQLGEPNSHCVGGELDMFEGQGAEPHVYYGTVHSNTAGAYTSIVADDQNSNNSETVAPDLTADFHTYGMKWTNGTVSWYLDNQFLMSSDAYYDSLNQPMFLLLQMWYGGWAHDDTKPSPDTLETQVDWVRVWQKAE
jgi:beta-glucanase (GH16 family)